MLRAMLQLDLLPSEDHNGSRGAWIQVAAKKKWHWLLVADSTFQLALKKMKTMGVTKNFVACEIITRFRLKRLSSET